MEHLGKKRPCWVAVACILGAPPVEGEAGEEVRIRLYADAPTIPQITGDYVGIWRRHWARHVSARGMPQRQMTWAGMVTRSAGRGLVGPLEIVEERQDGWDFWTHWSNASERALYELIARGFLEKS